MVRNSVLTMETTFYDEHSYPMGANVNQLKRSLTLDLNPAKHQMKRQKLSTAVTGPPVLSSPDLHMLKLATPDIEKIIFQNGLVTATPTPTQLQLFTAVPTEEQELYARGFVDALNELHHSDSSQGGLQPVELPASGVPSVGATYTNLDRASEGPFAYDMPLGVVKDEPQTVPSVSSSPPLSPIDMECQEKIKLERKRQRNRVAASKCRKRKLERISKLEDKVKLLKGENTELNSVMLKLKEHVCFLKEQVMEHVNGGCQMMGAAF